MSGDPVSGSASLVRTKIVERIGLLSGPPLLLLTPLATFLGYNDYSVLRLESLGCIAIFFGLGLVLGLPGALMGRIAAVLPTAIAILFIVDVQLDPFRLWGLPIAGALAACLLMCWLLRRHLATLVPLVGVTMLVTSQLVPARIELRNWNLPATESAIAKDAREAAAEELPIVVHIVLDEQIGIEGIPIEADPERHFANTLKSFYLEHGFKLYGRAYSTYQVTKTSLGTMLNMGAPPQRGAEFHSNNRYFKDMSDRGLRVHAYQTDYMDLCGDVETSKVSRCFESSIATIKSIEATELAIGQKTRAIVSVFLKLSFLTKELRRGFVAVRVAAEDVGLALPRWDDSPDKLSSISSMPILERFGRELGEAQPGSLYFAHILLPHYPYVYDASCAIQQDIDSWLYSTAPEALPRNNSEASRLERYRSYLAQVECTHEKLREVFAGLQRSGLYQKATILVHGDHGSRISIRTPLPQHWQKISPRDYIDTYSTLFAIKLPGQAGGYDRRILSINQLFSGYIQDGKIPEGTAWAGTPTVVIGTGIPDKANQSERRKRRLKRKRKNWGALEQPLPAFSFGEVDDKGEEIPTGS